MSQSSPTEDHLAARRPDDISHDLELLLGRLAESREAIVRLLAARSGDDDTVAAEEPDEEGAEEARTDDEVVAEGIWQVNEVQSPEPSPMGRLRPLPRPVEAADPERALPMGPSPRQVDPTEVMEPQLPGDVELYQLPSSLRRPGPPALELALIYREIARNSGEVPPEAAPVEVVHEPKPDGLERAAGPPGTARAAEVLDAPPVVKIPVPRKAPAPAQPVNVTKTDDSPRAAKGTSAARRRLLAVVLTAVGAVVLLTTLVSVIPSIVSAL